MKKALYLIACIIMLMSCQQNELPSIPTGEGVLEFANVRTNKASAAAVAIDPGLAVTVLDSEGNVRGSYAPGSVPAKVVLEPGAFTVKAYTPNAYTWHTADGGKGEAYYYGETTVVLEHDHTVRVNMAVPMMNYAVGLQMPEHFADIFPDYTFGLTSGERNVTLKDGERAYFDASDGGFSYVLNVTNADGGAFTAFPTVYADVQAGKLYQVSYEYEHNIPVSNVRVCD